MIRVSIKPGAVQNGRGRHSTFRHIWCHVVWTTLWQRTPSRSAPILRCSLSPGGGGAGLEPDGCANIDVPADLEKGLRDGRQESEEHLQNQQAEGTEEGGFGAKASTEELASPACRWSRDRRDPPETRSLRKVSVQCSVPRPNCVRLSAVGGCSRRLNDDHFVRAQLGWTLQKACQ